MEFFNKEMEGHKSSSAFLGDSLCLVMINVRRVQGANMRSSYHFSFFLFYLCLCFFVLTMPGNPANTSYKILTCLFTVVMSPMTGEEKTATD